VTADAVFYHGRKAVRVMSLPSADTSYDMQKSGTGGGIVVLSGGPITRKLPRNWCNVRVGDNTPGRPEQAPR
jgi:hypothetical protein